MTSQTGVEPVPSRNAGHVSVAVLWTSGPFHWARMRGGVLGLQNLLCFGLSDLGRLYLGHS